MKITLTQLLFLTRHKKYFLAALLFANFSITNIFIAAHCQETTKQDNIANPNIDAQELLPSATEPTAKEAPSLSDIADKVNLEVESSNKNIDRHLTGVVVKVSNTSESPLLINTDLATVTTDKTKYTSTQLPTFEIVEGPARGFMPQLGRDVRDTITAAVTVGAVQTIDGIRTQRKPVLKRYGVDEERRENEVTRFGKRLLWPGEVSQGIIYFSTGDSLVNSLLEIPISLPFGKDKNITEMISTKIVK